MQKRIERTAYLDKRCKGHHEQEAIARCYDA